MSEKEKDAIFKKITGFKDSQKEMAYLRELMSKKAPAKMEHKFCENLAIFRGISELEKEIKKLKKEMKKTHLLPIGYWVDKHRDEIVILANKLQNIEYRRQHE